MELKKLTTETLKIFNVVDVKNLGEALFDCILNNDCNKMDNFCSLVDNDLSKDWLQMIYQYYLAERENKKQDYTPQCLATFLSLLIGNSENTIDMCAGSGALTIQRWNEYPDMEFEFYEIVENVIPFLVFNMAIRNITSTVYHSNVLEETVFNVWKIEKGEKYGKVVNIKSTV